MYFKITVHCHRTGNRTKQQYKLEALLVHSLEIRPHLFQDNQHSIMVLQKQYQCTYKYTCTYT